jgi:hypothetical protein
MSVLLDQNSLEPPLEQMPNPLMPPIKYLGINPIQLSHSDRKVSLRSFYQQMVMIVHEAISVAHPMIPFINVLKEIQETFPIFIIQKDGSLLIPPAGNVIDCTSEFYS